MSAEFAQAGAHDRPSPRMDREAAELLAVQVLGFIAADEGRLGRFLKISGLSPETIRAAATGKVFLLGVLDYLAADEGLLRAFAIEERTHPQTVMAARAALAPALVSRAEPPTSSIVVQCERCKSTAIRRRADLPHAPPTAVKLTMPRCGKCGGGFDQIETWHDRRGNEID